MVADERSPRRIPLIRSLGATTTTWLSPPTQSLALRSWVRDLAMAPPVKGTVAIFACRNPTWVEWAIYCACWMRSLGYAPALVYFERELHSMFGFRSSLQGFSRLLSHAGYLKQVREIPDIEFLPLDEVLPPEPVVDGYAGFARDYADTVAAYDLHVEEHEPGDLGAEYSAAVRDRESMLLRTAGALEHVLTGLKRNAGSTRELHHIVSYSGLIGPTPAVLEVARRMGIDAVFVEGWSIRPGHMLCRVNRPALEYNIESWRSTIRSAGLDSAAAAAEVRLVQDRVVDSDLDWVAGMHQVQRSPASKLLPPAVSRFVDRHARVAVAATNVVGDSATLRRATIFKSQREWLSRLVGFFRDHPEWGLIVRAHPDEEWIGAKVRHRMGDVAREAAGSTGNVLVIHGHDDLNTYSLFPLASCGLVWMSTAGVDMVVRGVPTLVAAKPKYTGLGIVDEPSSPEEYFARLAAVLESPEPPKDAQVRAAMEYLHITTQEFSYLAFSKSYRGHRLRLGGHRPGGEFDTFYRVVARELPPESRPELRPRPPAPGVERP